MHNSTEKMRQTTLFGGFVKENKFYVLGFVSIDVLKLKKEVWFKKLNASQVALIDKHLKESYSDF